MKNKTNVFLCTWVMITMSSLCHADGHDLTTDADKCDADIALVTKHYDDGVTGTESRLSKAPASQGECENLTSFIRKANNMSQSIAVKQHWDRYVRMVKRGASCASPEWKEARNYVKSGPRASTTYLTVLALAQFCCAKNYVLPPLGDIVCKDSPDTVAE